MRKTHTMKNKYVKIFLLLVIPFLGCQKEELMMSESKISEQISYTWIKQFTPAEKQVTWQFQDGNIYMRQNENLIGKGTYSVDCSLTKAKVRIEGFEGGNDYMNETWQVIDLDNKILVITNLDKGTQEYEFIRKD